MKLYLTKEEYLKVKQEKIKWCNTFFGGWLNCCKFHTRLVLIIWTILVFIFGRQSG